MYIRDERVPVSAIVQALRSSLARHIHRGARAFIEGVWGPPAASADPGQAASGRYQAPFSQQDVDALDRVYIWAASIGEPPPEVAADLERFHDVVERVSVLVLTGCGEAEAAQPLDSYTLGFVQNFNADVERKYGDGWRPGHPDRWCGQEIVRPRGGR